MQLITNIITLLTLLQHHALLNTIQPTTPLTQEQAVAVLIESGWGESLHDEALAIMQCESEMLPLAQGDYWGTRPQALGLYQVHWQYYDNIDCTSVLSGHFVGYGAFYECRDGISLNPYYAVHNAYIARLVYERSDSWSMWSCRRVLPKNDDVH